MPRLKIYYLDDEEDLCSIFSDEFSSDEIEVVTFTEPQNAIEAAQKVVPDMLFLDYRLPATTGDEVAKKFLESIPKYLVTGDIEVKTEVKFQGIFSKPLNVEIIQKEISAMLKNFKAAG